MEMIVMHWLSSLDDRIFVLGIDRMLLTGQVAGFYEIDFKK